MARHPAGSAPISPEQEADGLGIETLHVVDQEAHGLGTALQGVVQRLGRPLGAGRCQGIGGVGHPRPAHRLDDQAEQRVGARRSVDGDDRRRHLERRGELAGERRLAEPAGSLDQDARMPARPLDESVAPHHDVPERGLRQTRHRCSLRDVARSGARAIAGRMLVGRRTRTFPPSGGRDSREPRPHGGGTTHGRIDERATGSPQAAVADPGSRRDPRADGGRWRRRRRRRGDTGRHDLAHRRHRRAHDRRAGGLDRRQHDADDRRRRRVPRPDRRGDRPRRALQDVRDPGGDLRRARLRRRHRERDHHRLRLLRRVHGERRHLLQRRVLHRVATRLDRVRRHPVAGRHRARQPPRPQLRARWCWCSCRPRPTTPPSTWCSAASTSPTPRPPRCATTPARWRCRCRPRGRRR